MSLELIREAVRVKQVIGEDTTQTIVESDIIVPDSKPDVSAILVVDGDPFIQSVDSTQGSVSVKGSIRFKILYVADDAMRSVKGINTSTDFSCSVDLDPVRAGMKCSARCDIEHVDFEILNGRKINAKAIVKVSAKAFDEREQEIISGLRSSDDVQVLSETLRISSYLGDNAADYTVSETLEVPSGKPTIREILRTDIKITGKDFKIDEDRILAKGEINVSTLYIGDNEEQDIQFMEHEIPFTQFIELPGVNQESVCELDFRIQDYNFEPGEDNDGEYRMLKGDVVLGISASAFNKKSIEVISDAYSPTSKLTLDREACEITEIAAENSSQVILKDTVDISVEDVGVSEVFNVLSKPALSEFRIINDKLVVEGLVGISILYLSDSAEQPVMCKNSEMPFRQSMDMKGLTPSMSCDVNLGIEHCSYSMVSSGEVEVRLVVDINAKAVSSVRMPLTNRISEAPQDDTRLDKQASITIYFVKPGDNLWKIAKRYSTTIDELKTANDIEDNDGLVPGQQVIVMKRQV